MFGLIKKLVEKLKYRLLRLFYSKEILDTPINFVVTPSGTLKSDILPTPTAGSTERASRFIGEPLQEPSTSRHGMTHRVAAPDSGKSRFVQLLLSYTMWGSFGDTDIKTLTYKLDQETRDFVKQAIINCHAVHTSANAASAHGNVQYSLAPVGNAYMLCFAGLNEILDIFSLAPATIRLENLGTFNSNALFAIHDLRIDQPVKAIAGYSLGGVYAIYYSLINRLNVPVITFGTPRCVGLDSKVLLRPQNIYQYCIKGDPVAHTPLIGGWYHPTQPKVIDYVDNRWSLLPSNQSWQDTLNEVSFGGRYNSFLAVLYLLVKSIVQSNSKHSIDTYLEAVTSLTSDHVP